jgi:hypothetical protein
MGGPATALPLGGRRGRRPAGTRSLIGVCSVATRARNGVATLFKIAQFNLRIKCLVRRVSNYSMVR